jgi:hypothetical protein
LHYQAPAAIPVEWSPMAIDLLNLIARFDDVSDRETDHAYFRTRVRSVAEYGYLYIVYKPPARDIVAAVDADLRFPPALREFYADWNGARLFFSALAIRGCLPSGQVYNRSDPFAVLPFDLGEVDRRSDHQLDEAGVICIGTYRSDGSVVCMHRDSGQVDCYVGRDLARVRREWSTLEEWMVSEITRLSLFFDSAGNCLISDEGLFLPGGDERPN